ncbi:ring-cleaving dioxygenase [Bacillus fonticola]|uniref:ring-cleaving dioxygenase n=1 Tax=Bacillus fonticola TaxID=2728853 RepID=UPI001476245F|nr:ring-cleaving dioxygenase [Bacillus fonticola]
MTRMTGIHHITAIVGNVQENVDFYAQVLGLRLVKRTVNFDDPGTYHLYFGDEKGSPGTIITFFPWSDAPRGTVGSGQVGVTTYVVPAGALPHWEQRLQAKGISFKKQERFGEELLAFEDPHGLKLELVAREEGKQNNWHTDELTKETAIKGFGGAILYSDHPTETVALLEQLMGLEKIAENDDYFRLRSTADLGNIIDIPKSPHPRGRGGVGTVHHIAWRAADDHDELRWRSALELNGFSTTEVRDRQYFKSIYFQESGGILFEIATDEPGFLTDEPDETLGTDLKLPPWLEEHRGKITKLLPALTDSSR